MIKKLVISSLFVCTLTCCHRNQLADFNQARLDINTNVLGQYLITLASDHFQGRRPLSPGEDITTAYLAGEFKKLGLAPAFGGSYFQDVPLVDVVAKPTDMLIKYANGNLVLKNIDQFVAFTKRLVPAISLKDAPLVFAGYGVVAPEYQWNDYAGLDVKGKVVIVLVNDPGFGNGDTTLFEGRTMTYYGRWTYKFEEAARQGAAGCIIVHEDEAAAYPWSVVTSTRAKGSNIQLQDINKHKDACAVEAWITKDAAHELFAKNGVNYDSAKLSANKRGFKALAFKSSVSIDLAISLHPGVSHNVGAVLKGAKRPDEAIVYSAHWDHFGIGIPVDGDSIYNGAADDASGVSQVLSIARAFTKLKQTPERSVLFIAFTGEESGLLGSQQYVQNPVFDLNKTVADINFDVTSFWGRMKDVTLISLGQSELDTYVSKAALEQDRYIAPNPTPEKGNFFRADHFWFVRKGVPVIYGAGSSDHREKGKDYASQKRSEFITLHYHKPSDEYNPKIHDLSGTVEDAQLFFKVGYQLSNETTFPQWNKNSTWKRDGNQ